MSIIIFRGSSNGKVMVCLRAEILWSFHRL